MTTLDPRTAEALTRHMLRELGEPPGWLIRAVTSLAGGVPLIIEETIHDLIDARVILVKEGRWALAQATATTVPLPRTVEGLFTARLERIEPELLAILRSAAVGGRRFWRGMLHEVTEGGCTADQIRILMERGFFIERHEILIQNEPDFAFAQLAVQEAVYNNTPRPRRKQLHRLVASWLERRARGKRGWHEDALGHHFQEAGEPLRALPYKREAAEHAIRMMAIEDAARHLESCREILTGAALNEMPELERRTALAAVIADLVQHLVLTGRLERAIQLADSAPFREEDPGPPDVHVLVARTAIWKGWALEHSGRFAEAHEAFLRARRIIRDERGVLALMAVTGEAGTMDKLGDPSGCAETLRAALMPYPKTPGSSPALDRALSAAYRLLSNAENGLGAREAAVRSVVLAYNLALSAAAPVEEVDALNSHAAIHYSRGELDQAETKWRAALAQADRWDLLQHKSILLSNLGELEWLRADAAGALSTLQRAEALHSHLRSDQGLSDTYRLMSECHLALEDLARAEERGRKALSLAERTGSLALLGYCHRTMARVAHALAARSPGDEKPRGDVRLHLLASLSAFENAKLEPEVRNARAIAEELGVPDLSPPKKKPN